MPKQLSHSVFFGWEACELRYGILCHNNHRSFSQLMQQFCLGFVFAIITLCGWPTTSMQSLHTHCHYLSVPLSLSLSHPTVSFLLSYLLSGLSSACQSCQNVHVRSSDCVYNARNTNAIVSPWSYGRPFCCLYIPIDMGYSYIDFTFTCETGVSCLSFSLSLSPSSQFATPAHSQTSI